jgi:rare lipoprotein A
VRFNCKVHLADHDRKFLFASLFLVLLAVLFSGCSSSPKIKVPADQHKPVAKLPSAKPGNAAPELPKANSGRGAYYQDDGPGDNTPLDLESTVEPIPVVEPFSRSGNKPYMVFGKTYTPIKDSTTPFKQRGVASWYGKKFHGQKTSSGELYDMYKITAAHPTLPIPSYARVTNVSNGKQIIVRVNDRGPFHSSRIIDLSYTAALKLGYLGKGSSVMEIERLLPADIEKMAENRKNQPAPLDHSLQNVEPIIAPIDAKQEIKMDQISLDELIASQENTPVEKLSSTLTAPFQIPAFYIQFGAYAIRANAEASMSSLKTKLKIGLPDFDIVEQGSLYRLISGPFNSRAEAIKAMLQNGEIAGFKALIVQR